MGCAVLFGSMCLASTTAGAVVGYIAGARTGWWTGNDTIQVGGDCGISSLCTVECPGWDCLVDGCFSFRRVTGVDVENCSFTNAEAWRGCRVDPCFWMGTYFEGCEECEYSHNYCDSLWRVLAFGGGPGDQDPNFGCWSLGLICEPG